jgi:hypothetical protein
MNLHAMARSARHRRWLAVFVVLVFGFKALVAPGYMFASVDGHARLVLCPAGLHYAPGMHAMPGMVHGPAMDHAAHASLAAAQCPYALAGGAALLATVAQPAEPHYVVLQPARPCAAPSVPISPPSRYHAPRGPPSLA